MVLAISLECDLGLEKASLDSDLQKSQQSISVEQSAGEARLRVFGGRGVQLVHQRPPVFAVSAAARQLGDA